VAVATVWEFGLRHISNTHSALQSIIPLLLSEILCYIYHKKAKIEENPMV